LTKFNKNPVVRRENFCANQEKNMTVPLVIVTNKTVGAKRVAAYHEGRGSQER
jgi:hypothetical protein